MKKKTFHVSPNYGKPKESHMMFLLAKLQLAHVPRAYTDKMTASTVQLCWFHLCWLLLYYLFLKGSSRAKMLMDSDMLNNNIVFSDFVYIAAVFLPGNFFVHHPAKIGVIKYSTRLHIKH